MKKILFISAIAATLGFTSRQAAFTIDCMKVQGNTNVCTVATTSGESGEWTFSDYPHITFTGASVEKAFSTHSPVTFETPYTTLITLNENGSVSTGSVTCNANFRCHGKVNR